MKKKEINYYRNKVITETKESEFKDLIRSYAELENRLKAMEENFKMNESEIKSIIYKRNPFQTNQNEFIQQTKQTVIISMTFGV